jgi:GAG-pre-integrase domain
MGHGVPHTSIKSYCTGIMQEYTEPFLLIVSDPINDSFTNTDTGTLTSTPQIMDMTPIHNSSLSDTDAIHNFDFDLQIVDTSISISPEEELMKWHQRLSHMPMSRIQKLALSGTLPNRIAKCRRPLCPACAYGKMTRRKWRTTPDTSSITPKNITCGSMVSVDQLQSNIPGLTAPMKGTPTRKRYHIATIYVDHYSDFTYVHLQQSTTSCEFKRIALSYGVHVL